ncbi:MAG: ABC transporter permease [Eubacteriales bacterium]|nr:ABC transporter permease [Eubacteriales bacterium]
MKQKKKLFKNDMTSIIFASVVVIIILSFAAKGFTSESNINSILKATSITIAVGMAQLVVLSVGQFNLALGSIACLSAMTSAWLMQEAGVAVIPALLMAILIGIALGWVQGLLVAKSRINPFVVTLALSSVYLGIATIVFQGLLLNRISVSVKAINKASLLGIPVLFLIALAIVAVMYVFMNRTYFGRRLLSTGESKKAALVSGIKPKFQIITAHTISGTLSAIAGILAMSRLGAAQLTLGSDWLLMSFAAPVLGGTLLSGGRVSVVGTIFGALLLNMINTGLVLLHVNMYWTQTFLGAVLIAAFAIDSLRQRLLAKGREV